MDCKVKKIAIIGTGAMGKRIAIKAATYNYEVKLYDIDIDKLKNFVRSWKKYVKKTDSLGTITFCTDISNTVADVDLIIEAIPEILELKLETFNQIDKVAPHNAIIASNSSSFPISKLESAVERKDKLLNIHFYMGLDELSLIEMADIMKGNETSEETFEIGKNWIESIKFRPLIVKKESYGFLFNRIWRAIKKECLKVWAGGYADIEDIDAAWKIALGTPDGPFMTMDKIGLDVVYDIEMSYFRNSRNPDDMPPQALKEMVDKGFLGLKTKRGFYEY
ncbi:MAG: 3-hydroxyacyl-CoA dehydrogenase family protein [Promethearchaeota archaeon]|nr:MAG: 3-hydroxyacyl-CoA dehydrogenase family protein [Candidatus Lokiarchaeota archaeon]